MTRNTRIIFGAGVDVGLERGGGRAMAMSKMTTMTMGGGGGGGRGAKGEKHLGGWGDDDYHAEEEDINEDNGGSRVGGGGGGVRKNNMTLDQSSFFPSGDLSIANFRLSRPGDERKTMTTGEEEEGVGSINASMIGTVETQRARVPGVRNPRRVRRRSLLRSRRQGVLNRRSHRRRQM